MTMVATKARPSAAEIAQHVGALIELMQRLGEFLARETAQVRSRHVAEIAALHPEKLRLTRSYQAALGMLKTTGVTHKDLPAPLSAALRLAGERLNQAADENRFALQVGCAATDRLIGAIAQAITTQRPATSGYQAGCTPRRPSAVSGIACDRRL